MVIYIVEKDNKQQLYSQGIPISDIKKIKGMIVKNVKKIDGKITITLK